MGQKGLGAGSCSFPTDDCKFLTGNTGAENFHFDPTFVQNRDLQSQNLVFLEGNFRTIRKFFDRVKFKRGSCLPPLPRRYR